MTKFSEDQIAQLKAPLDGKTVKTREQGGRNVSYVEGWHVIAEANRIFGFDGWARETILLQETNRELLKLKKRNGEEYEQWRVGYLARVRVTVGGIIREGVGFGSGMGRVEMLGDAIESAAKEAETDAMKRALMTFGNPFGLALYDKEQREVEKADKAAPAKAAARSAAPATWPEFKSITEWADWSKAELPKMQAAQATAWEAHFRAWLNKLRASNDPAHVAMSADLLNLYNEALTRKQAA